MNLDPVFLARLQFAVTVGFHFLFPPLTIGLAWLLVILEWVGWRRHDERYVRAAQFFGKLLGLTFAVGVATGIVMEFQFGMNWAQYSKFVGDIFGAPLAAEAVFAFFLESGFLGLYLFGRGRISKGAHWFAILMVAVGSVISAFWIIVANSWQQTPAGFVVQNGRAELTDFAAAVFNPSTWLRFGHTMMAALASGSFFMAGVSAFLLKRNSWDEMARASMRISLVVGLVSAVLTLMPFGHEQGRLVARNQPEKFAAIEGVYDTKTGAPLALFGFPTEPPPDMKAPVEIPKMLSWLAFGELDAKITGIKEFPESDRPPLWMTFVSFHNMVILGCFLILLMLVAVRGLQRGTIWTNHRLLQVLICSTPLPLIACQFGWVAAEVGRQPWAVYHVLRTSQAVSPVVSAEQILASLLVFIAVYLLLGALYIFMVVKEVRHQAHVHQSANPVPGR
jgi:cytochrome bd ubiquinol oxidase subunit I